MDRVLVVRPEGVLTREVHREREGEITLGADLPELLESLHPRDRRQGPSRRQEVGLSRGAARVAQAEGDGVLDGRCHPTTLRRRSSDVEKVGGSLTPVGRLDRNGDRTCVALVDQIANSGCTGGLDVSVGEPTRMAAIYVQDGEACPWTYALRLSTTKS